MEAMNKAIRLGFATALLLSASTWCLGQQDEENPNAEPDRPTAVELLEKHIPPLTRPQGARWSLLVWGGMGHIEVLDALLDRGISPMFNDTRTPGGIRKNLDGLKRLQKRNVPVVILPQGLVQIVYMKRGRRPGCDHKPPARPVEVNRDFTCPALMENHPWLHREARATEAICNALKQAGITPAGILVDFETGLYLRNGAELLERVRVAIDEALKCPRCLETYGADKLNTPEKFGALANRIRSHVQKVALADPVKKAFPDAHTGNFYAWPVRRLPLPENEFPAYGYEGSGMTVAQPRRYLTAGWRGAGRSQAKADWIGFLSCIETYSPSASVMKKDEILLPWIGTVYSRGRLREKRGHAFPSDHGTAEIVRHAMMRGAESMAVFMPMGIGAPFPEEFGDIPEKELGPWLMLMRGMVRGYNDMLRFNDFLRAARPVNFKISGTADKLDATTANYSAMATKEKALVRATCWTDKPVVQSVKLFDRRVELTFPPGGAWYWVTADGTVTQIEPDDYGRPKE